MKTPRKKTFANDLEKWLKSSEPKTLLGLSKVFEAKSFALIFLILMSVPALPLPTGGITHVFEIIVMALSLLFIIGRDDIPSRWHHQKIPSVMQKRSLPFLLGRIRSLERISRPRLSKFIAHWLSTAIIGLIIFILTLVAFLAPPFSGLDTLPALGVVLISLGLILEDYIFILAGIIVGSLGVLLVVGLGTLVVNFIRSLF